MMILTAGGEETTQKCIGVSLSRIIRRDMDDLD